MNIGVTGHRPKDIKIGYHNGSNEFVKWRLKQLAKAALKRYTSDVVNIGMALGWDTAIAEACIELNIPFIAFVPFKTQPILWSAEEQTRYNELLGKAYEVKVLYGDTFEKWKFQKRNEAIVDDSDMMLTLWNTEKHNGGTFNCIRYAKEKHVDIVNLWSVWEKRKDVKFSYPNMRLCQIAYEEEVYPSVENFFQAMKTTDAFTRHQFTIYLPNEARKKGEDIVVRNDWEQVKDNVMEYGLRKKFSYPTFNRELALSGDDDIIYWNLWHDNYWGVCYCNKCKATGENKLGRLLMKIRQEVCEPE